MVINASPTGRIRLDSRGGSGVTLHRATDLAAALRLACAAVLAALALVLLSATPLLPTSPAGAGLGLGANGVAQAFADDGGDDDDGDVVYGGHLSDAVGDYYMQYVAELYNNDELTCDDVTVDLEVVESEVEENDAITAGADQLSISGTDAQLLGATFTLAHQYDFDTNPVGRFLLAATAGQGESVTLGFFLDDSTEPFATVRLKTQTDDTWKAYSEVTVDVSDLGIVGTHDVSFRVIKCRSDEATIHMTGFEFVQNTVPVVYVNIDESMGTIEAMNSSENHSVNCYGDITIQVPDGYTSVNTGKALTGGTYELEYIRGRGNSTWQASKKPYKLKLDSKASLLGMNSGKHWALIANYYDPSLIRNRTTYWLGEQVGMSYTPQCEPVEVVMNGQYLGSYYLSQTIRVDDGGVNIDQLTPDITSGDDLTGGYLLSLGAWTKDEDKYNFTTKYAKAELQVESPDQSSGNQEQFDYIENYMQTLENALYLGDMDTAESMLDYESAAMYYWFEEFTRNGDGFTSGSCYFYKTRYGKLYWGPLWDFDYVAWGAINYTDDPFTHSWMHRMSFWNKCLLMDDDYLEVVYDAWDQLRAKLQEAIADGGIIDQYIADQKAAFAYNYEHTKANIDEGEPGDATFMTYEGEGERFKTWISSRIDWVDENLDSLKILSTNIVLKDRDGSQIGTVKGQLGSWIGADALPDAPAHDGYYFVDWQWSYMQSFDEYLKDQGLTEDDYLHKLVDEQGMDEDDALLQIAKYHAEGIEVTGRLQNGSTEVVDGLTLTAVYTDADSVVVPEVLYVPRADVYAVDYESPIAKLFNNITLSVSYAPFDAEMVDLKCTSSNLAVATVTGSRNLKIVGAGTSTITFTTINGLTVSVTLHVLPEATWNELGGLKVCAQLAQGSLTMELGTCQGLELNGYVENAVEETPATFESSDSSVVAVGPGGLVEAVGLGTATITCYTLNDEQSTCTITVTRDGQPEVLECMWKRINGKWFCYDAEGNVQEGWSRGGTSDAWYYLDPVRYGAMATGWAKVNGSWYYLDPSSGRMATGWKKVGGAWYYLGANGKMATGWRKVGSSWYWFASSGKMATDWKKIDGTWYYLKASGAMATGWQKINGTWYWFASNGAMATGKTLIAGKYQSFAASGAWIKAL